MKIFIFISFALLSSSCSSRLKNLVQREYRLSILQGHTTEKSIELSVVMPEGLDYSLKLMDISSDKVFQESKLTEKSRGFSDYKVVKIQYENLAPSKYIFEIIHSGDNRVIDRRFLSTINNTNSELRFVVISCMDDHYDEQSHIIFEQLVQKNPDMILMIGDNVYVDRNLKRGKFANTRDLWNRYIETRMTLPLFFQRNLIPVYATIDDHDFGINDGDATYAYRSESLNVFRTFFAQENIPEQMSSSSLTFLKNTGGLDLLFLDGRSARINGKHQFGEDHLVWLTELLSKRNSPLLVFSGTQFFGSYHPFESYQGRFKEEFEQFMNSLKNYQYPIVFFSGDRHMSEIMKIEGDYLGYETYEITSSPVLANVYPGSILKYPNPRQIAAVDDVINYSLITAKKTKDKELNLRVEQYTIDRLIYIKNLKVSI